MLFLQDPPAPTEYLARSFVDNSRKSTIAQQAKRKQKWGLLRGSLAADSLLPEGAAGPLPSFEAYNAADLEVLIRVNAAMPARIRDYADAVLRFDTIVANLGPIRQHYGHPVTIDSKFKLFNERQRMFCGWCGWIGLLLF